MAVTRTRGRNGRGPDEVSELDKRIIEHLQEDGIDDDRDGQEGQE